MSMMRPAIAIDSRGFGKRFVLRDAEVLESPSSIGADFKLFAATFLAGFVFVSILLA
jgi:hypothetical protein